MTSLSRALAAAVLICSVVTPAQAAAPSHSERILFDGGGDDVLNGVRYHSFRIPSLVRTNTNTLLAFVEGRVDANVDHGNINLLYKRSTNNGASWSTLREVVGAGLGTWGNPTAVVDTSNNKVWVFMSWNPAGYSIDGAGGTTKITKWEHRKVYVSSSTDDGLTLSEPVDMTAELKPRQYADGSEWAWDAIGPGVGIQTSAGWLVIPAQHRSIYSTDHGLTWKVQRVVDRSTQRYQEQTSEATLLEAANGELYRNDRPTPPTWNTAKRRWVTRGTIVGGFAPFAPDQTLLEPTNGCQASVLRYNWDAPARIMFLNSASTETRTKMRLRVSYDDGRTWPIDRALSDAPLPSPSPSYKEGGYSSMAKTADYHVAALVEVNENVDANSSSRRSIAFRKMNLPWILNGRPEPTG